MCGIAGFSISNEDHRKIQSRVLSRGLLNQIVERGRDATGAAWTETTDEGLGVWFMKEAVPAGNFTQHLTEMPRFTRSAILHTRWATKGSPSNNDNNHPIVVPRIIGVHNGVISNDDQIISQLGGQRTAQVDSEAIFRLIAGSENPLSELHRLDGRAAIAWFDTEDPTDLHLARLQGSPLWIGQTKGGSMIFASTEAHLRRATVYSDAILTDKWEVDEWTYLKVKNGLITDCSNIRNAVAA